jgi:hypothetical protein
MSTKKKPLAIPPNAVRVWRGYRASTISQDDFFTRLGTVFIPSTVEMQIQAGLDTYIPTVPCGMPNKPDTTPDETAILFWDSQQTYTDCFKLLACRTYTLTHAACYTPQSGAAFPVLFNGTLTAEQPVYLIDKPADWMHGKVTHVIGGRPANVQPAAFINNVAAALKTIQTSGVDGAIACAGNDYVVYWVLGDKKNSAGAIAKLCDWNTIAKPKNTTLTKGLWDVWPGMTVKPGNSYNMQFKRRWER